MSPVTFTVFAVLIVLLAGPSSSQNEDGYLEEAQELVRLPRFAQGGRGDGFTMNDYGFKIIDTGSQYGYESKIPGGRARFVMGAGGSGSGEEGSTDAPTTEGEAATTMAP